MMAKKILMGLGLCSLLAFPATNANAEAQFCTNVEVMMAGSFNGGKVVQVRNTRADCGGWPAGEQRFFFLDDASGAGNAMLATALSAQAAGSRVMLQTQGITTFTSGSTLTFIYAQTELNP